MDNIKFESENFSVSEVADGVYAAIEKGDNTGSNAGIIDLGNHTVVFDTFLNIDASKELKKISEELTAKQANFVINSHSHTDHIIGNSIFSDNAVIISSRKTRDMIEISAREFEKEKDQYNPRIKELEALKHTEKSNTELQNMDNELIFLRNLVKPGVRIRIPDMTFDGRTILHGSKRSLHLVKHDTAHSAGDVVAYLPEDKICFTGDLLFTEYQPWFGSGNPEKLINSLYEILSYDVDQFIPGHGRLSTKEDVILQIRYINEIIQLVKSKGSRNVMDYSVEELSPVFKGWKSLCFSWNIKYLIDRASSSEKV